MISSFVFAMALILTAPPAARASAKTAPEKEGWSAAKVKYTIVRLGTGPEARVKLKLRDGSKLKGYVSHIDEDSFQVTDERRGTVTTVAYTQVRRVQVPGHPVAKKILEGVSGVAGAFLIMWGMRG